MSSGNGTECGTSLGIGTMEQPSARSSSDSSRRCQKSETEPDSSAMVCFLPDVLRTTSWLSTRSNSASNESESPCISRVRKPRALIS